jgi:homospermidine synthase
MLRASPRWKGQVAMNQVAFDGKIVMIGFGSIGQGVLPLLFRDFGVTPDRLIVVTAEDRGIEIAERFGFEFIVEPLNAENFREVLTPLVDKGDFIVNLSVEVASIELIRFARARGAYYVDTCIEPWPGGYTDPTKTPSERSNYALREQALALRNELGAGPTAVIAHGANPGIVSHFVKEALLHLARDTGVDATPPTSRAGWAKLSQRLGVKVVHIAERDTQIPTLPKEPGEFVNTWSIDGFVSEGCQPAELGWGTHEKGLPADGHRHAFGCDAAIYLMRPGAGTRVRSWTPLEGPYHGFLVTHNESISIADYLTVREDGRTTYRPTVHYAYHPCDAAVLSLHELAGKNWEMQERKRLIVDEVIAGIDELGVLLMGHARGAYWYGSRLGNEETRRLVPFNNATSLQVCAGVLGAMVWALANPNAGIVEADELDHALVMAVARPYLGNMIGVYGDWTPLVGRAALFPEDLDTDDPWQFRNFRVV